LAEGGVWFNGERDILLFNSMTAIEALLRTSQFIFPGQQTLFDERVEGNKEVKIIAVRLTENDKNNKQRLSKNLKLLSISIGVKTLYIGEFLLLVQRYRSFCALPNLRVDCS
jgi:hypothetical protein